MPPEDMQIIYAVFAGSAIREGFGKLTILGAWGHVGIWEGEGIKFSHATRLRHPFFYSQGFAEVWFR
jgi:hypothetical protein